MMQNQYRDFWPRYRGYLLATTLLFALGVIGGCLVAIYYPSAIEQAVKLVASSLAQMGEDILGGGTTRGILLLLKHNLIAVLSTTLFGLLLGLYPISSMLLNGVLIGVFGVISTRNSSLLLFLVGIMPHGIFEIPGLLVGSALGLRLGLGPLLNRSRDTKRAGSWQGYRRELACTLMLLPLPIILLTVAAIIEVAITPRLLQALL